MLIEHLDVDGIIKSVMERYQGASMKLVKSDFDNMLFQFRDIEEGKNYTADLPKLRDGLSLLIELTLNGKYNNGVFPRGAISDAGNWDDIDQDALAQCACLKKIVYG